MIGDACTRFHSLLIVSAQDLLGHYPLPIDEFFLPIRHGGSGIRLTSRLSVPAYYSCRAQFTTFTDEVLQHCWATLLKSQESFIPCSISSSSRSVVSPIFNEFLQFYQDQRFRAA